MTQGYFFGRVTPVKSSVYQLVIMFDEQHASMHATYLIHVQLVPQPHT